MKRLFGGGGPKAPAPTLDDAVKRVTKVLSFFFQNFVRGDILLLNDDIVD
jgi:hypothetical protein